MDDLELRARFPVVDAMGRESVYASHRGAAGANGDDLRLKNAYQGTLTEHFGNMQEVLQVIDCAPF